MRLLAALAVLLGASVWARAEEPKACDELKTEIAKKLDAKNVQQYSLDIVAKDKDAEGKVVGTCDGGTKKIVYRRGAPAAEKPAADSAKK